MKVVRILFALVVLVAAVVALIWLLPSRNSLALVEPVATESVAPASSAPLDMPPSESRADRADRPVAESVPVAASTSPTSSPIPTCRVEIALVPTEGDLRKVPIDVQCFDGSGLRLDPEKTLVGTWLVPDAKPGSFHVEARPVGFWMPAGESFVVGPGETSKRVEVPIRPAPALRVRWQATDGRPLLTAVQEDGGFPAPTILSLVLGTDPVSAGDPTPASSKPFYRIVFPLAAGSANDKPELLWTGAPADAFALLSPPVLPPCAVHACIGGLVVESVSVLPGTQEILFRTDLDLVRRFRTKVRFCVVASETGEALAGVGFSSTSDSGTLFGQVFLGADGCREETRLPPGRWTLLFDLKGRAHQERDIELEAGADLDLGKITLQPDCPLSVPVSFPDGSPADGNITAALLPLGGPRDSRAVPGTLVRNGAFTFTQVPDEPLVLVVDHARWSATPHLVERCDAGGSRDGFTLQLVEGTAVVLDFGPTSPLAPLVLVTDANGLPVARKQIGLTGHVRLHLAPGDYKVVRPAIPGAYAFTVGRESAVIEIR